MFERLTHLLTRHRWTVLSAIYNPPTGRGVAYSEDGSRAVWGFTEVLLSCSCGAMRQDRLIGDHSGIKASAELAELERMTR